MTRRFSVYGQLDVHGLETAQRGQNAAEIGQKAAAQPFKARRLPQHLHVEAGAGNVEEIAIVHLPDIDGAGGAVQLTLERLERILGQREHLDEVVARAAGHKIERHVPSGQAADDFVDGAVAADADDAVGALTEGRIGQAHGMADILRCVAAIGQAALFQQLAHGVNDGGRLAAVRGGVRDDDKHMITSMLFFAELVSVFQKIHKTIPLNGVGSRL